MKRTILAAMILYSGVTMAGLPGATGFFGGMEALNLQPRTGDMDELLVFPLIDGVGTPISVHAMHPGYQWNFRMFAGFKFGDDDLTASYLRSRMNFTDHIESPFSATPGLPAGSVPRWLDLDSWTGLTGRVTFDLDDVYLVFGHPIYVNPAWTVRLAAGVEYSRLISHATVEGIAIDDGDGIIHPLQDDNVLYGFKAKSHTQGFGPRIEAAMLYHTPLGIGVFAKANAALLIASRKVELESVNTIILDSTYDFHNRHTAIPKVGLRLGLDYSYAFGGVGGEGGCSPTVVTLEGGWQVEEYIHAIERPLGFSNLNIINPLTSVSNAVTKLSNYGYQGWFVGVVVGGNWL